MRAAIEKMAEEGEVYTGVFTQVAFIIIVLVGRMIRERMMMGLVVVLTLDKRRHTQ